MFSFFKKAKHTRLDDQVYIGRSTADAACIAEFLKLNSENVTVFLCCYFEKSQHRIQDLLSDANSTIYRMDNLSNTSHLGSMRTKSRISTNCVFLFAEHHPHFSYEETVIHEIENMCGENKPSIRFYASLEDPLMQRFGAENIIGMMKKMGMKEDEVISHAMVTKSIVRAQEKIANKVPSIVTAKSQEEWMNVNLPKE